MCVIIILNVRLQNFSWHCIQFLILTCAGVWIGFSRVKVYILLVLIRNCQGKVTFKANMCSHHFHGKKLKIVSMNVILFFIYRHMYTYRWNVKFKETFCENPWWICAGKLYILVIQRGSVIHVVSLLCKVYDMPFSYVYCIKSCDFVAGI